VKASGGHPEFLDPAPRGDLAAAHVAPFRRAGHLPSRVHLHRGFRLRGRLVRFATHRRKSTAG
jgi:hypothetical protein